MRFLIRKENMRSGSGPGYRQTAAGVRDANRRQREWAGRRADRLWPAAVLAVLSLTAIVCAVILLFSVTNRPASQPDAAATAATVPEETGGTGAAGSPRTKWLEWKEGQFVRVEYGTKTSTELDTSGFIDPSTKNSHDLVEWAKMAWENQWGYVWGTFGYVLTEELLAGRIEQYPNELGEYEDLIREKWMGRRAADCVGLIKGYGWYDPGTGGIEYGFGDMPDTGTDGMWDAAEVKGDIDAMPDEPGLLVYSTAGHIGVYIGDGCAIEAISHAGGVVKTKVADRPWTGWLQCPYIRYDADGRESSHLSHIPDKEENIWN